MQIQRIPGQLAYTPKKIGTQDYPANPALDTWSASTEVPSLAKFFRMSAAKNPEGPYLGARVGDSYQFQSYREVESSVEKMAAGLIGLNLQPGDRVATFADNRPEWRIADFAIAYAGLVHAPLYNQMSDRNAEYILKDSGARAVVVDSADRLKQVLASNLPDLKTIIVAGNVDLSKESDPRLVSWNDFQAQGESQLPHQKAEMEARIAATRPQDMGGMVYTSGSTGDPKGVLLSHGNWLSDVEGVLRMANNDPTATLTSVRRDDRYPSVLPQGHVMGRVADYVITAEGGSIAYPESLMAFKKDMKILKPTVMAVTPLFFQKIYEEAEKKSRKDDGPVINPRIAGLGAGAAGAALGGVSGALAGTMFGGGLLQWGLAIAGATLGGVLADKVATEGAEKLTKSAVFDWAVGNSREYYESHGNPSIGQRVGHFLGEKMVFSKVRQSVDQATGGEIRLMMSGGAPLGGEVEGLFRSAGFQIAQGYGLSETAGASIMNNPTRAQLGTVGQTLPGVEARLDSETQEIQLRGPNIMSGGYLNKPEKTAESFTADGWYRTGDKGKVVSVPTRSPLTLGALGAAAGAGLGALAGAALGHPTLGATLAGVLGGAVGVGVAKSETEDYYSITGRIKSQFKLPGGEYVTPEPIEENLKGSPFIAEAVVVGAKDRDMVGALIIPKFDNLKGWAASKGIPTDDLNLLISNPEVKDLLRKEALERSSVHAKHEQVRAVALLDHEFTVAADELTPSFKVKRPVVLERYAELIDSMF